MPYKETPFCHTERGQTAHLNTAWQIQSGDLSSDTPLWNLLVFRDHLWARLICNFCIPRVSFQEVFSQRGLSSCCGFGQDLGRQKTQRSSPLLLAWKVTQKDSTGSFALCRCLSWLTTCVGDMQTAWVRIYGLPWSHSQCPENVMRVVMYWGTVVLEECFSFNTHNRWLPQRIK